jgi:hypothetical protein
MRKASTKLLEQGIQTPSPAPDLIPAETKNQPRTHIGIGTANGGTSPKHSSPSREVFQHGHVVGGAGRHEDSTAPWIRSGKRLMAHRNLAYSALARSES